MNCWELMSQINQAVVHLTEQIGKTRYFLDNLFLKSSFLYLKKRNI